MCAMRITDQMYSGAVKVQQGESNQSGISEPVAAQSSTAPLITARNRPDGRAEGWSRKCKLKAKMATYQLHGSGHEEWHNKIVDTASWFTDGTDTPEPVVRLIDVESHLRGIIHMRTRDNSAEVCLSLITPKGKWQTGIWFEIARKDEVNVSWCTDWSGRELTTISLEIQTTTH